MSKKKILLIALVVVVVGAVVAGNLMTSSSNATKVQADLTKLRTITETVSASGRIQPRTKVDITSQVNGEIIGIYAKEGDFVEVGKLLVVLDTVQLRSDVDQARYSVNEINARLTGSKASLAQKKEEFERQKKLLEIDGTAQSIFDLAEYAFINAKSSYQATLAQADQFKSRYEKQLDNLEKAKIGAPMTGILTYVDCEVGEIAAAQTPFTQGRKLMTISDLSVFEVEVEVDETEVNKIDIAQVCEIEVDAYPDTVFYGMVTEIGNTAVLYGQGTENQSTNFKVKVTFDDPAVKIRPGMSATVDITTNENLNAISVPYSAVVMRNYNMDSLMQARVGAEMDDSGVQAAETTGSDLVKSDDEEEHEDLKGAFVVRDGKAFFVQIKTGIADKKNIVVTDGIQDGDSVVSGPYRVLRSIKDGDEVEVKSKDDKGNN